MQRSMIPLVMFGRLACAVLSVVAVGDKDVPWRAQSDIARRGALVEPVSGIEDAANPLSAIALAMQPPEDDSYKWLFTLVATKNCQWCEQARRDFDNDPKLAAWVNTKDYAKSWAHWQVVQIEDKSQEWRWKDFRPTSFPTLIVQPPVNGSWGDSHTIVFAHQGYLKPVDMDAAIRKAIQQYAAKVYPRRLAWSAAPTAQQPHVLHAGFQQAIADPPSGWTPPVTPPAPLPPLPGTPMYPTVPPVSPTVTPDLGTLLGQLIAALIGGPAVANILLLAILAWQVYRSFAKREGIPLLIADTSAAQLAQLLQSAIRPSNDAAPPAQKAA